MVGRIDVSQDEFPLGVRLAGRGRIEFYRTAFPGPMDTNLRHLALLFTGETRGCGEGKYR